VEKIENPSRERILARIKSALDTPTQLASSPPAGPAFAPIPDPLHRFQEECVFNKAECLVTPNMEASAVAVSEILTSVPAGNVFVQDAPSLRRMAAIMNSGRDLHWSTEGPPGETSRATITLAESLVAATGSVFVSAACGGRKASIVAPVHIVVATLSQLVPDLATAFQKMGTRGTITQNSMLCLITGPSRTGDIEKILVLGAHGPQRLVIVLAMQDD